VELITQHRDHFVALGVWTAKVFTDLSFHPIVNDFLELFVRKNKLKLKCFDTNFFNQLFLQSNGRLQLFERPGNTLGNGCFADFVRASFYHGDTLLDTRNNEVEVALLALFRG